MASVTLGKSPVILDDFIRIVTGEAKALIHAASILDMQKAAMGVENLSDFDQFEDIKGEKLSTRISRAVCVARLITLLEAHTSTTPRVVNFLADLLNDSSIELRVSADSPLKSLAQYFQPRSGASPKPPAITKPEYDALVGSQAESLVPAAALALFAHQAHELSDIADCVAALTCEATQASTSSFGAFRQEVCRPYKAAALVADHLNLLLEKSLEVNQSKRKTEFAALSSIPDIHCGARMLIDATYKFAKVELNSAEIVGSSPFVPGATPGQMRQLDTAMKILEDASLDRSQTLLDLQQTQEYKLKPETTAAATKKLAELRAVKTPTVFSLPELTRRVLSLEAALSLEAMLSCDQLATKEVAAVTAAAEKEAEKKKRQAEYEAKTGKSSVNKKAEKKQEAGKGLILGKGSSAFRTYLLRDSQASNLETSCLKAVTSPLTVSDAGFLNELLTATNQICKPKLPKGTRDSEPEQMSIREKTFAIIKGVFQGHGAVGIDTPVFERKEVLTGKYGEDSKLIYDLADQGGEMLSLRYDLTVPFARYVASNGVTQIKRYHMGRVYRRDSPAIKSGRFREFYQCDFDIAGTYSRMIPDAEVVKVLCDVLSALNLGKFKVKYNHRKLLDALMDVCGVPEQKFRAICSAIDKLDKTPWAEVRMEMVGQKGLAPAVADRLAKFVTREPTSSPWTLLQELRATEAFASHPGAQEALADLELAFTYMEALGCLQFVSFDLSLARGLDYYTGVIYEAVLTDTNQVGSIAAGGRYDKLVGMFSLSPVPAVGVSVGIERIFTILEQLERERGSVRATQTEVLVCSNGSGLLEERMKLAALLWARGFKAEFLFDLAPHRRKQMDYASENRIPVVLWIGEEVPADQVRVKQLAAWTEENVARDQLLDYLQKLLR